jgi:hypothetical protein
MTFLLFLARAYRSWLRMRIAVKMSSFAGQGIFLQTLGGTQPTNWTEGKASR